MTPTKQCYDGFKQAYRYFNRYLTPATLSAAIAVLKSLETRLLETDTTNS